MEYCRTQARRHKNRRRLLYNHIIGLSQKDGNDKPLYDYQQIIFDSLVSQTGNKHLWRTNERLRPSSNSIEEHDYDEDKDQLEEEQEEEASGTTTNQVF